MPYTIALLLILKIYFIFISFFFAIALYFKKYNIIAINFIFCKHFKDNYYKIIAIYFITYNIIIKKRYKMQIKKAIKHLYKAKKAKFLSKVILKVKDFIKRLLKK